VSQSNSSRRPPSPVVPAAPRRAAKPRCSRRTSLSNTISFFIAHPFLRTHIILDHPTPRQTTDHNNLIAVIPTRRYFKGAR
jgi:hypothetical protein